MHLLALLLACADDPTPAAGPRADLPTALHGDPGLAADPSPSGPPLPPPVPATCTSADLVGITPPELVTYVQTHDMACLYYLWTFDAPVAAVLSSDPHVEAVLADVAARGPTWAPPDTLNLREALFLARLRWYHGFYQAGAFTGSDVLPETVTALAAVAGNPALLGTADDVEDVLDQWVNLADASDQSWRHVDLLTDLLRAWTGPRRLDYGAQLVIYDIAVTISRQLGNGVAAFIAAADADLMDAVDDAITEGLAAPAPAWVTNNLIWALGHFPLVPALATDAIARLTDRYQTLPAYSEPWLWVVAGLDDFAACQTAIPGLTVCRDDVAPAVEAAVFPNTWTFDDGALVLRTPLAEAEARRLVHAIHEVHAAASRRLGRVAPLQGDPNGTLTVKIYDSPASYGIYQPFLYGLSTSNGGIYIEQDGTLYTYDRTPAQSIFTLEELTRHEMAHAIIGRWLVDGMWGSAPIYAANRMVFFDEGMAEFLAGASRGDGVPPRAILVDQVAADGVNRLHVDDVVTATYGDFRFYPYAGLFFAWLDANDPARLLSLIDAVRRGDVAAFDAWVTAAAADAALDAAYQGWLDDLVAGALPSVDPVTPALPGGAFATVDAARVQAVFRSTPLGAGARCTIAETDSLGRYTCHGQWLGPVVPVSVPQAFAYLNDRADQLVDAVDAVIAARGAGLPAAGHTLLATTCHLGRTALVGPSGSTRPVVGWACHGTLRPPVTAVPTALARLTDDVTAAGLGVASCAQVGAEARCDLTLTTSPYPAGTPTATFAAELSVRHGLVADRVYARGRGFHAGTTCSLVGSVTVVGGRGEQVVRCSRL
jgi:microbial collagenase